MEPLAGMSSVSLWYGLRDHFDVEIAATLFDTAAAPPGARSAPEPN